MTGDQIDITLVGWCTDPYGRHDARWFSQGRPTKLVRDFGTESYDVPPAEPPTQPAVRIQNEPPPSNGVLRADDVQRQSLLDPRAIADHAFDVYPLMGQPTWPVDPDVPIRHPRAWTVVTLVGLLFVIIGIVLPASASGDVIRHFSPSATRASEVLSRGVTAPACPSTGEYVGAGNAEADVSVSPANADQVIRMYRGTQVEIVFPGAEPVIWPAPSLCTLDTSEAYGGRGGANDYIARSNRLILVSLTERNGSQVVVGLDVMVSPSSAWLSSLRGPLILGGIFIFLVGGLTRVRAMKRWRPFVVR